MKSPLALYKEVAEDFGITAGKQQHDRLKQAFVTSQVQEQRAVVNRLIIDTAMARFDLEQAQDPISKAAYQKKVAQFEDDLRQFSKTLDFFMELEKELGPAEDGTGHPDSF